MQTPLRILLVDDDQPFREAVRSQVSQYGGYEVVDEAADGSQAIRKCNQLAPDLVLIDVALPSVSGIVAAEAIRVVSPRSRILFVSSERSSEIVREALRTGATGYVVKSFVGRELLPALQAVSRGDWFVSRGVEMS